MTENNKKHFPTIKQSFGLIAKILLISIPVSIPLVIFSIFEDSFEEYSLFQSLGLLILQIIIFLWIIKIAKSEIKEQGLWDFKWKKPKVSIDILGIFLIMTFALIIIMALF